MSLATTTAAAAAPANKPHHGSGRSKRYVGVWLVCSSDIHHHTHMYNITHTHTEREKGEANKQRDNKQTGWSMNKYWQKLWFVQEPLDDQQELKRQKNREAAKRCREKKLQQTEELTKVWFVINDLNKFACNNCKLVYDKIELKMTIVRPSMTRVNLLLADGNTTVLVNDTIPQVSRLENGKIYVSLYTDICTSVCLFVFVCFYFVCVCVCVFVKTLYHGK